MFARILIELDLRYPIKRTVLVNNGNEPPFVVLVSYEVIFQVCCRCGQHRTGLHSCPLRAFNDNFFMVGHIGQEHVVYPPQMADNDFINPFLSDDVSIIFPQPLVANQFPLSSDLPSENHDGGSWKIVSRKRKGNDALFSKFGSLPNNSTKYNFKNNSLVTPGQSFEEAAAGSEASPTDPTKKKEVIVLSDSSQEVD
ncbi:hypothetical protein RchiOBHm_Chr7g0182921 [Rosa chinensis]|uniref:Uncharacterized protein n=1 Tax=Rosa chinensis TaxID=74649 RepID=A0A2P6P304_ROSCH|nr:hypothetical protein RchiOBHm_Chr7g0182921 [Rosa chinensis]